MSEQRDFFREVERDYWAEAEGLKEEERALIARYLEPGEPTLDAGTGGGRIPRALATLGFGDLTGFDFAPELIAAARAADAEDVIAFDVADATALPYENGRFGQALYLQQVICTIEDSAGREAALGEAARVLRPGGRALFSFVCFETRVASPAQRAYVTYLRAFRTLRRDRRPIQSMPRLRLSGRFDPGAIRDAGPYNWWYRAEEAAGALAAAGFEVIAIGFGEDAVAGSLRANAAEALAGGARGTLYALARKPD
jgi:SAM-dependent methyltransferase